jgi:general secretion pathway protein M
MKVHRRQVVAIALFCIVVLVPVLAGAYLISKYQWAESKLAELEPRYARLIGLEASKGQMTRAMASSADFITRFAYPATLDVSQAGNDAQQKIRTITTGAGLSIASSQVLAPKSDTHFDRIPLTVRLEGELPALQAALTVLATQSPAIHFEGFTVATNGQVKADTAQRLAIQFNLFVLRAKK